MMDGGGLTIGHAALSIAAGIFVPAMMLLSARSFASLAVRFWQARQEDLGTRGGRVQ